MGLPPHDLTPLGVQLRQLVSVGATPLMLGRFAVLQVSAAAGTHDPEVLGNALMNAYLACNDDGLLGRFAFVSITEHAEGSVAPTAPIAQIATTPPPREHLPSSARMPVSEEIAMAVQQALAQQRQQRAGSAVRFERLKLQLNNGRRTTVAVPRQLLQAFVARLGDSALKDLLSAHAGPLAMGMKRSTALQQAMQGALEQTTTRRGGLLSVVKAS